MGGGAPKGVGILVEFLTGTADVLLGFCANYGSDLSVYLLCQCYQTSLEANAHRHAQ